MQIFDRIKARLLEKGLSPEDLRRIDLAMNHLNSAGYDNWGLDPEALKTSLLMTKWLYSHYFRVSTVGVSNVPTGRALIVANHGGQIPVDAMMVEISLLMEGNPPRIARGMVERWAQTLPFVSTFFARCGQTVGDHRNCRDLLENDQCVLVFPEGVGGSGKTIFKRYQLQKFGTGFVRLALETKTPIIPCAVIGSEEAYPSVYNFEWLAKLIRAPYLPITPFFPFFGALGLVPLPTKMSVRFGKPILFEADPDSPDSTVDGFVNEVKKALQSEINQGLKERKGIFFPEEGPKEDSKERRKEKRK